MTVSPRIPLHATEFRFYRGVAALGQPGRPRAELTLPARHYGQLISVPVLAVTAWACEGEAEAGVADGEAATPVTPV